MESECKAHFRFDKEEEYKTLLRFRKRKNKTLFTGHVEGQFSLFFFLHQARRKYNALFSAKQREKIPSVPAQSGSLRERPRSLPRPQFLLRNAGCKSEAARGRVLRPLSAITVAVCGCQQIFEADPSSACLCEDSGANSEGRKAGIMVRNYAFILCLSVYLTIYLFIYLCT